VRSWKSSNNDPLDVEAAGRLVPVGQVLHAHGTEGELMVYPYLTELPSYERLGEVVLRAQTGQWVKHRLTQVRVAGERILLRLDGLASREAVRPWVGGEVCVPRDSLPPPRSGEFYWFDLEGLTVLTQDGETLGRVADFFPTGSNEVLVVRDGAREILLPFIKDVILAVDEAQGAIRVRVLPGLL
jgi:16S rRNA processing protein RimM